MAKLVITAALVLVLTCNAATAETVLSFSENYPFMGDTIQFTCLSNNAATLEEVSNVVLLDNNHQTDRYRFKRDCTNGNWSEDATGLNITLVAYPNFDWIVKLADSSSYKCIVNTCAAPETLEKSQDQLLSVLEPLGDPWWTHPTNEKITVTEDEEITLHFRCEATLVNTGDVLKLFLFHEGTMAFNKTKTSYKTTVNVSVADIVHSVFMRDDHPVFECSITNFANPSRTSVISKAIEVLYKTDDIQFSSSNDASYSKLQELSAEQWSLEISGPTDQDYIVSCHANGFPHPIVNLFRADQNIGTGTGTGSYTVRPANEVEKVFTIKCVAQYSHENKYVEVTESVEVKLTGSAAALAYSFVTLLLASLLSMHFM